MGTDNLFQKVEKSFVNGTNDREAYPKRWIAVLVQKNCEKKAEAKLNNLGFETYLPIQKEERQWSDRRKIIDRIVIPMIVFVRVDKRSAQSIRNLSFVHKLITYPGFKEIATPIPDEQINQLKFLLSNAESEVSILSDIKVGDEVQIIKGTLKGVKGVLCMMNTKTPKLAIRIDCLGYATVSIPMSFIGKI
jgi:transcriptional antiterminator NusG